VTENPSVRSRGSLGSRVTTSSPPSDPRLQVRLRLTGPQWATATLTLDQLDQRTRGAKRVWPRRSMPSCARSAACQQQPKPRQCGAIECNQRGRSRHRAASAAVRVLGIRLSASPKPPSLQEYLVATKHDTSIPMIERNYSKYIADHADMLSRRAMLDLDGALADGVISLKRQATATR